MTTQMTATVVGGMLKPDQPLSLADQTRVRLTIEPVEAWSRDKALAALESIQARIEKHPIDGGGVRYTRDELHERR